MIQNSIEWHRFRAGRITGSAFGNVLAKPTTKRYREYLSQLVDDIKGVPYFEDDKPWFRPGREMEPRAIGMYEWETGHDVERPAYIRHPKYDFIMVSPDATTMDIYIVIKSHTSLAQYRKSVERFPANHKPQVQGGLWISRKEVCHFVDYFESETKRLINIREVEHDYDYQKRLERSCLDFWDKVIRGVCCG